MYIYKKVINAFKIMTHFSISSSLNFTQFLMGQMARLQRKEDSARRSDLSISAWAKYGRLSLSCASELQC